MTRRGCVHLVPGELGPEVDVDDLDGLAGRVVASARRRQAAAPAAGHDAGIVALVLEIRRAGLDLDSMRGRVREIAGRSPTRGEVLAAIRIQDAPRRRPVLPAASRGVH